MENRQKEIKTNAAEKMARRAFKRACFPPSFTVAHMCLVCTCVLVSAGVCVCVFVCVAVGDRVEVRSQYYPEQSNPLKDQYIFVYKVKITNHSSQTIQLVSRTWEIKAIEATEVCTMC